MVQLLGVFKEYLLWSLLLWVLFFLAFAAMFAQGQLIAFARGLGRVLLSILTSPFIFLRNAVSTMQGFTAAQEQHVRASEQYLLNKALLVLQALVIVASIGALAAGVVTTWNVWVPPSEVRKDAREYAKAVDTQKDVAETAAKTAGNLDAEWAQREQGAVAKYRRDREKQIADATRRTTTIEREMGTYGGQYTAQILDEIRSSISQWSTDSIESLGNARLRIDRIVEGYRYWISDWDRTALKGWNDAWHTKAVASLQLANFSAEDLRKVEQPGYAEAKTNRDSSAAMLTSMQETLKVKEEQASLKWKAAFWSALACFFTFLMFVWLAGTVIELAGLGIRIAGDVRTIRERALSLSDQGREATPQRMIAGPAEGLLTAPPPVST